MTEPEPLRVRGVYPTLDGLREVEVDVPPGPVADAIREHALRGLSVDPDSTTIVAAGGLCAPLGDLVPRVEPGILDAFLHPERYPAGDAVVDDEDDEPTSEQLRRPEAWLPRAEELRRELDADDALPIADALANAYAAGYRAGEWNS